MTKILTPQMKAVDLFAGCGGLSLGLHQAGFDVVGAVEIDDLAVDTYRSNHTSVEVWHSDIRTVSVDTLMEKLKLKQGDLNLLAGCPPCQGFSTLRTMNGGKEIDDARNDLVLEFIRFVRGLLPSAVMMENVPGLADDRRLAELVEELCELGYDCHYAVLDASEYGVPQRRRRLILLASRFGTINFARRARVSPTVSTAIKGLGRVGGSGDALHDSHREDRSLAIKELIRSIPRNGGSRSALPKSKRLKCHEDCDGFNDVYGRMRWDSVSPTITTGCMNPSKGRFLHPTCHRTITLREAALLQSFPKSYSFPTDVGKYPVAKMIGNALPPEFIRRHAASIRRHLLIHNQ